jgi:hypothetical protein
MRSIIFALGYLLSLPAWCQEQYIVDPEFSDLGNRFYQRVIGIVYEPSLDTYMLAGTFAGGNPNVPCLNRVTDNGESHFSWNPNFLNTCDGVNYNFFPSPAGYRINFNMIQIGFNATFTETNIPDLSGTEQQTVSSPRGWADDDGYVYVGSNWVMTDEEGAPETGLLRFDPNGNRDIEFPHVDCGHPTFFNGGYVADIFEYDDERLMLGGAFDSLNQHFSPRIARVFKDGTVDTTFSSGLESHFKAYTINVDSQGRVLVYHLPGGSEETPNDTIEIWRLLTDGSLDPSWNPIDLAISEEDTYAGSARSSIIYADGSILIHGAFNLVNGVPRSSICMVDSSGNLLDTFNDFPFEIDDVSQPQLAPFSDTPQLIDIVQTPDSGLLIGGIFTHYQGEAHLNLVKLILDTGVNTIDHDFPIKTKVYPNPATDQITLELSNPKNLTVSSVQVADLSGRTMASYPSGNGVIDVSGLSAGMYLLQVVGPSNTILSVERVVIN